MARVSTRWRIAVISLGALIAVLAGTGTAWAGGQGDEHRSDNGEEHSSDKGQHPYGGTTTTTAGSGPAVTCTLSATSGSPGTILTATVAGVPVGEMVRILIAGDEVAHEAAVGDAGERTTVQVDFALPNLDEGRYPVAAVGATFTAECGVGTVGGAEVLGSSITQGGGASLPKTGIYVAVLLAVGTALVLVGRAVLDESRRRRRALDRADSRRPSRV